METRKEVKLDKNVLTAREANVMEMLLGADGTCYDVEDIADHLMCTPEQVEEIIERSIKKFDIPGQIGMPVAE